MKQGRLSPISTSCPILVACLRDVRGLADPRNPYANTLSGGVG